MGDWKITGTKGGSVDVAATFIDAISGGPIINALNGQGPSIHHHPTTYVVKDGNGNTKHVTATSRQEAGEKISKGKFDR